MVDQYLDECRNISTSAATFGNVIIYLNHEKAGSAAGLLKSGVARLFCILVRLALFF